MPATGSNLTPDELARRGAEVFDHRVRPSLRPEDDDKFVALDVLTGEYEIDADDYTAVTRLRARLPTAEVWLMRGRPANRLSDEAGPLILLFGHRRHDRYGGQL
jgi:hypothetical protein